MDDTGLRVEEQQVVVRRMNSDWRSAQWQLNDLRSVDSVSINQTALSCFPPFILRLPFGSNFFVCLQPLSRERLPLFTLTVHFFCFLFFHLCLCVSSLHHVPLSLSFCTCPRFCHLDSFRSFYISALVRDQKNEAIFLCYSCCSLSKSR